MRVAARAPDDLASNRDRRARSRRGVIPTSQHSSIGAASSRSFITRSWTTGTVTCDARGVREQFAPCALVSHAGPSAMSRSARENFVRACPDRSNVQTLTRAAAARAPPIARRRGNPLADLLPSRNRSSRGSN